MKAKKIDLRPYKIRVAVQSEVMRRILSTPGIVGLLQESAHWSNQELNSLMMQGPIEQDFNVKESIISVMFSEQLRLSGLEIHERGKLADKIKNCKDEEILLEDGEYQVVRNAFEQHQGFGLNTRELVRRIFEAEDVEVEEKKK